MSIKIAGNGIQWLVVDDDGKTLSSFYSQEEANQELERLRKEKIDRKHHH